MDINVQNFDSGAMAFVNDNEYSNMDSANMGSTPVTLADGTVVEKPYGIHPLRFLRQLRNEGKIQLGKTNVPAKSETKQPTNNQPTTNKITPKIVEQIQQIEQPKKNKLILPIAIGGGVLVLGVILYFALRKNN